MALEATGEGLLRAAGAGDVELGALVDVADAFGKVPLHVTPADVAREKGHADLADRLR
jgi:hypothetical protein